MASNPIVIEPPLVIMFDALTCDLARDVAPAFKIDKSELWTWLGSGRRNPTAAARPVS